MNRHPVSAVIYARYSSAGQRDVSIEDQVREIKAYAESHKYNIIHVYADRAMTGRNDSRPDFRKMIADAEKHLFQCVLVYKFDRFARNQYDSVIYKKKLSDAGVKLVAVMEPIPDGHGAKILESIYMAMAEEYSENLSQNIKRGLRGNALKCLANHVPSYGYRINKETRKYEIEPESAKVVQKIFEMTLAGKLQREVLQWLKEIGQPRSMTWLYHTLKNERYIGTYICKDIKIKGGMPQIISESDFERVRAIMQQRQKKPQLRPYHYLFSGKIYCGYCHKMMSGESATSKTGRIYRYYCCMESKRHKRCSKQRINAVLLEQKVIEALKETIFSEPIIDRLADDMYNYLNSAKTSALSSVKKQLADTEKRIKNIQSNIERAARVPETLLSRLCELEELKKELSVRLQAEQLEFDDFQKEELKSIVRNFDKTDNASLVNVFLTKLIVYDEYAIIKYDVSGDNEERLDFVPTTMWWTTLSPYTKFCIRNAALYVQIKLIA